MLSCQPGTFGVNQFLKGVRKKQRNDKLKLEFAVLSTLCVMPIDLFRAPPLFKLLLYMRFIQRIGWPGAGGRFAGERGRAIPIVTVIIIKSMPHPGA